MFNTNSKKHWVILFIALNLFLFSIAIFVQPETQTEQLEIYKDNSYNFVGGGLLLLVFIFIWGSYNGDFE